MGFGSGAKKYEKLLASCCRVSVFCAVSDILPSMRIIGIDPGTGILGFGVVEVHKNSFSLVDAGVIRTPAHTPLDERLEEIYNGLTQIIKETQPDVMAVEKLFFSQNVTTAISVSHARGVAMLTGRQAKLRVFDSEFWLAGKAGIFTSQDLIYCRAAGTARPLI